MVLLVFRTSQLSYLAVQFVAMALLREQSNATVEQLQSAQTVAVMQQHAAFQRAPSVVMGRAVAIVNIAPRVLFAARK